MSRHLLTGFSLALVVLFSSPAGAQDQASLSLGAGYVDPENVDGSAFWVTANYRFRIANRFLLEPEVGYWEKDADLSTFDVSVEDLNFGINALYALADSDAGLVPWAGAGVGLHLVKGVADFDEDGDDDAGSTETKFGIHLLGGADFVLTETFAVYAAARYDFVSDLNQFKLYGGVRYRF